MDPENRISEVLFGSGELAQADLLVCSDIEGEYKGVKKQGNGNTVFSFSPFH